MSTAGSISLDDDGMPGWQAALTQKSDWDSYKRNYFAKYGKYPLGAKNLGQFTSRYAKKMERQAARNATGQGYRDWKAMGWGAEAPPSSVPFSDAQMLSRGRYRRRRKAPVRRRRYVRRRGKYGFGRFTRDITNAGKKLTTRKQRRSIGKFIGTSAKTAFNQYLGTGMYTAGSGSYHTMGNTTSTNALIEGSMNSVPSFPSLTDEQGDVIVTHSEYVRDIYGNQAGENFVNFGLSLNPGLEATFPWLSQLAQNFDEYVMIQCMFTYRSTMTSVISSTAGQVGNVVMVTDYNPEKPIFDDKMRMMQYDGSQSGKITKDALHGVECDPRKLSGTEGKRVRTKPVLSTGDKMDYDLGTFQLAISNTPDVIANSTIGELWVSYRVLLRKPKFYSTLGLGISRSDYTSHELTDMGGTTGRFDAWGTSWNGVAGYPLAGQQNSIAFHVQAVLDQIRAVNNETLFPLETFTVASTGQPQAIIPAATGTITAPSGVEAKTLIIFPGHVAGKYEIMLTQERAYGAAATTSGLIDELIDVGGNVTPIFDMHQGGATGVDAASFCKVADLGTSGGAMATQTSGTSDNNQFPSGVSRVIIFHVNVEVASNGKDNVIVLHHTINNNQAWDRSDLRIMEYNSYDTYSPPEFVNSQGVVITTTTQATGTLSNVQNTNHSRAITLG